MYWYFTAIYNLTRVYSTFYHFGCVPAVEVSTINVHHVTRLIGFVPADEKKKKKICCFMLF